jgi:hypothetical protein
MWQKILVGLGIEILSRVAKAIGKKLSSWWTKIFRHKKTDGILDRKKELRAQLKALKANKELSPADRERLIDETIKDLNNIQRNSITDYEL